MRHGFVVSGLLTLLLALGCGGGSASVRAKSMPAGGTFTGVWFSPQYGEMHLVQNGATVVGRYEKGERTGRIQGNVTGDLLRFKWTEKREMVIGRASETSGRGYFRLVKDEREDVFKLLGEWGHDQSETGGGPWNAVKSQKRQPDLDGSGGGDSMPPDSSSGDEEADWSEEDDGGGDEASDDLSDL